MVTIKIPENPNKRNFDKEVDDACAAVLKEMEKHPRHECGGVSINHGCTHYHTLPDVAAEVAKLFKAKGYHAHYCYAQNGVPHCLEVTTYPTNHDI